MKIFSKRILFVSILTLLMTITIVVLPVSSAEFPSKPISLIVCTGPGGGFDTYARGVAQVMEKYVGKPIVIKNIPGAGGRTGTNAVYRARPDGHTIGILNVPGLIASQYLMETKFDMSKFEWIGGCNIETYVMAANAKIPYNTIADLQKSKTPFNHGFYGKGSTAFNVAIIGLNAMKISFTAVTGYAGSAEAIVGCIRGDVDLLTYATTTILPYVKSGDLKPIAIYSVERDEFYPDTQTVAEAGFKNLAVLGVPRLFAGPPGLPKDRVKFLEEALLKALKDPELIAWSKQAKRPLTAIDSQTAVELVKDSGEIYQQYVPLLKKYY